MDNYYKKKRKKPEPEITLESREEADVLSKVPLYDSTSFSMVQEETCPYCGGIGKFQAVTTHPFLSNIKKFIEVPCVCYTSKVVAAEYKLLKHTGAFYVHPDKLDPRISVNFENLGMNQNLILTGNYNSFLMAIKSLIMKYRFDARSPRILFSKAIDIIHDFHVPQEDGQAPHLSSTGSYALAIILFGTIEKNQALAPCMAQMVQNRLEEKKPLWIYFPETMPTLSPANQEYSPDLAIFLERYFKRLSITSVGEIELPHSSSKASVRNF